MKIICECVAILALACFGLPSIVAIEEQPRSLRSAHAIFSEEFFECVLFEIHALMIKPGDPGIHRLTCMADDHSTYRVKNVPDNFFEAPMVSGITRIRVLTSAVSQAEYNVDVAEGNGTVIDNPRADVGRYTKTKKSARLALIVRVFDSNNIGPSVSQAYLSTKIFGTGGTDLYNLASGYDTISGGMTTFAPGSFATSNNGVMDLTLEQPINISTDTAYDIEPMATSALNNLPNWDWDLIDHVMFVLSATIDFLDAAAFAQLPGDISVYHEEWAAIYIVQMHEMGHNLGMHHSGLGTDLVNDQYEDPTCWMGAHVFEDEGPPSTFNGAKSWEFGWYNSHHVEIDPNGASADLKLIGINDYLNNERTSDHTTVVKINGDSETLYMLYNKKEGINSGTDGYGDHVTIVHSPGVLQISWFRAGLDAGDIYEAANFRDGKKLVVEVCEMASGTPDIARTIVYLDTVNNISCDDTSPQTSPSKSPQTSPIFDDDSSCMDSLYFLEKYNAKKKTLVVKECSWLENNPKKIGKYCKKKVKYARDENTGVVYKPPHDACPLLCHLCDHFYEEPKFKFFWKYKKQKSVLKNCTWLGRQKKSKMSKICSLLNTDVIYPFAAEICPTTCFYLIE